MTDLYTLLLFSDYGVELSSEPLERPICVTPQAITIVLLYNHTIFNVQYFKYLKSNFSGI